MSTPGAMRCARSAGAATIQSPRASAARRRIAAPPDEKTFDMWYLIYNITRRRARAARAASAADRRPIGREPSEKKELVDAAARTPSRLRVDGDAVPRLPG